MHITYLASAVGDWLNEIGEFFDGVENVMTSSLFNLVIIVLLLWLLKKFGMIFISALIRKSIRRDKDAATKDEQKREDTIVGISEAVFKISIWIFGTMLVLAQLEVDITPLITGVSFVGVAVGFGAQSAIKDFVSGLFIILENQYRVGDVVSIAGVSGVVESISIRQTVLRDLDGNQHHVPNGSISVATNKTFGHSRVNMNVGVSYDSDLDRVEKAVNSVGEKLAKDKDYKDLITQAPKYTWVRDFGESEISIKILGKVKAGKQWTVASEFRKRLKVEFDKQGIEIPFPQRVMITKKLKK